MLAAVDVNLRTVHVGRASRTQEVDQRSDFLGLPSRCIGTSRSTISAVPGDRIDVSISPGAMALTRIPCGPKSKAISRVSADSAALDVA